MNYCFLIHYYYFFADIYWYKQFVSLHCKPSPAQLCFYQLILVMCGLRLMGECRCCSQPQFARSLMTIHTNAIIIWSWGASRGDEDRNSIWRGVQKASNTKTLIDVIHQFGHKCRFRVSLSEICEVFVLFGSHISHCWLPIMPPPHPISLFFIFSPSHPVFFCFLDGDKWRGGFGTANTDNASAKPTSVTLRREVRMDANKMWRKLLPGIKHQAKSFHMGSRSHNGKKKKKLSNWVQKTFFSNKSSIAMIIII